MSRAYSPGARVCCALGALLALGAQGVACAKPPAAAPADATLTRRVGASCEQPQTQDLLAQAPYGEALGEDDVPITGIRPLAAQTDAWRADDLQVAIRCGRRPDDPEQPSNDCELVIRRGKAERVLPLLGAGDMLPNSDTYALEPPSRVDMGSMSEAALVLRWSVQGDPQPAVGSQQDEWIALVGISSLKVLYGPAATTARGAGGLRDCNAAVTLRRCGDLVELEHERQCQSSLCAQADPEEREELGLDCSPEAPVIQRARLAP